MLGSEVRGLAVGVAELGDPLIGSHVVSSSEPIVQPGQAETLDAVPVDLGYPQDGQSAGVVIRNWAANRDPVRLSSGARQQVAVKSLPPHPLELHELASVKAGPDGGGASSSLTSCG
ncbi:MAG: hypothetical protein QOJ35_2557 [Solirubrobacteraceae bacterium]|nr:hypothetical protein [Solirubrobacteraceae bacterium]